MDQESAHKKQKTEEEVDENEDFKMRKITSYRSRFPKFSTNKNVSKFIIENLGSDPLLNLSRIVKQIVDEAYDASQQEYGRPPHMYIFMLTGFGINDPIKVTAYSREHDTDIMMIIEEVEKLAQSDKLNDFLNNIINVSVTTVNVPGGSMPKINVTEHFGLNKSACIQINNSDKFCLFYALEVGRVYHDQNILYEAKKEKKEPCIPAFYNKYRFNQLLTSEEQQKQLASALMERINADLTKADYGIEYLRAVQSFYDLNFPGMYRVACVEAGGNGPMVLWKGPLGRKYEVVLLLNNSHFDALKSVARYFKLKNFCLDCEASYEFDLYHSYKCKARCEFCGKMGWGNCSPQEKNDISCENCNREFKSYQCYENHLQGACKHYIKCKICEQIYATRGPAHICGAKYCKKCQGTHDPGRECFVQPIKTKKEKLYRIGVFDFETSQDLLIKEGIYEHKVCYVSLRWTCTECEKEENQNCSMCATKEGTLEKSRSWSWYTSTDPLDDFISFLFQGFQNEKTEFILYAHNGGRFDNHFVIKNLYKRSLTPRVLMTGLKIYEISINNLRIRDSYLILQTPLDGLCNTFSLDVEEKMFFPYMFLRKENKDIQLPTFPPIDDYLPQSMKIEKFLKFSKWYADNFNTPFALRNELKIYCENDTMILLRSMTTMRKLLLKITGGYDPLHRSTSIAGIAMGIYRHMFMRENTISVIPEGGYEKLDRCSDKCIKLMEWIAKKRGINIMHGGNGREHQIGKYKVDGFCQQTRTVFEFLGCYYHSHPPCCTPEDVSPNGKINRVNYGDTLARIAEIRKMGFCVEEFWECEVDAAMKKDPEMKSFFSDLNTKGAIEMDSSEGGPALTKFLPKQPLKQKSHISTLRPSILSSISRWHTRRECPTSSFPSAHKSYGLPPQDIVHDGLYKVRVLPPQDLLYPILPARISPDDPRLIFPLCIRCRGSGPCRHSEQERSWTTTATSLELREALKNGYKVLACYRIWQYGTMENLFKEYVQRVIKLKVEASGFPPNIQTTEQKEQWKREYYEKLGVDIDLNSVQFNGGLRHIAKLLLNSLWGKFGQRNTLMKNVVVNSPSNYYDLVTNKKLRISQLIPVPNAAMRIVYTEKSAFVREHGCSNPVVALWTTSAARLRLHSFMALVRDDPHSELIYTDTDSIILSHPRGACPIKIGSFLGEMAQEYADYDIVEVCAPGPKQYALMLRHKRTGEIIYIIKIRGITLNVGNDQRITYSKFKAMTMKYYLDKQEEKTFFQYSRIGPSKDSSVLTRYQGKYYRPVNHKGFVLDNDLQIYPFGYIKK